MSDKACAERAEQTVFANKAYEYVESGRKGQVVVYSVLFVVFFVLFASGFLINGKAFIWYVDGLEQQYMFFIMQGEWLRELLSNVFIEHDFTIPMWSDRIGYGADYILSSLNTIGNPINWISVFFTPETADVGLNATVPITLYLAGLFFLGYCNYKNMDRFSSLIGALVYIFGGYSLIAFTQIYMLYPLVLGVLVLWGVDKVFDRRSPVLFILAMSLCFLCSVSMAYTVCLLLFVYCLAKVFLLDEKTTAKSFILWLSKIVGCIALGAIIGCVLFLPGAISILSQDRLSLDRPNDLVYPLSYYLTLFSGFIKEDAIGADCYYGFAPIAFLCVVGVFVCKRDSKSRRRDRILLVVLFVVLSAFLCLPIAGRVFNGFAYANNRWVWAYCLLVSCIVAYCLPLVRAELANGNKKFMVASVIYVVVFAFVLIWYASQTFDIAALVLFMTVAACYALCRNRVLFNVAIVGLMALGCFATSYQWGAGMSSNQVALGRAYLNAYTNNPATTVVENVEDSDVRYDHAKVYSYRNGNWANGMKNQSFYNSFYNGSIDEYHSSLGLATSSMNFSYSTLNSRSALEALGGTEYFVTAEGDESYLPPLFDELAGVKTVGDNSYAAYATEDTLPLAFVYDSAVSRDFYDSLSVMERQDVLTQSVVVDDARGDVEFEQYTFEIPSTLSFSAPEGDNGFSVKDDLDASSKELGTRIEGNSITITQPNTVLYLDADIPAATEAYFVCEGMDFRELSDDEKPENKLNFAQRREAFQASLLSSDKKECKILVYGYDTTQEIWFMNNKHHLYGGKDDWAVNVGYSESERSGIALLFDTPGVYSFDSYGVFAQDVLDVKKDVSELASKGAQNITETRNGYECDVDIDKDGEFLYFRIPYGKGWSATVNGSPVNIVKANLGFMAIPLDSGHYSVELHYETPGLAVGALLSCLGVVTLVVLVAIRGRSHRSSGGRLVLDGFEGMNQ